MSIFTWLKQKTTDDFIAPIKNLVEDLEAHAASRLAEAVAHNEVIEKYEAMRDEINVDVDRALKFATKVRSFFN